MKFIAFKEFREAYQTTIQSVSMYLGTDLKKILRELQLGLTKLSLLDNFQSFTHDVTIAASAEVQLQNLFKDGSIPTQRVIVRGSDGSQNIVDGDTEWDENFVYLKNTGASSASATVIFLK